MPPFRPAGSPTSLNLEIAVQIAAELLRPRHFYVGPELKLEWDHAEREETSWELFQGRLLDPAHTRRRRAFETRNVHQIENGVRSAEPLLSLKWDAPARRFYVVRGIDSYVWEGYDSGGGVILSRERRKWVRELVGAAALDDFTDAGEFRDELMRLLFHAVVGTSRLPLTSVEAPLPAFSFGQLLYCHGIGEPGADPVRTIESLARAIANSELNWLERVKLLEAFLHAVALEELNEASTLLARYSNEKDLVALLRGLFNEASLSPYTGLGEKTAALLDALERDGFLPEAEVVDFLGWLLRQLGRHLTAYDLVTFHHRGANYPDALVLDAVFKAYLARTERRPDLFLETAGGDEAVRHVKRLRRRALRQGWLIRRRYEEWPVPDFPTSPGENNRVLPSSHPRLPEEQILQQSRRTRRLYAGDPLPSHLGPRAAEALLQSAADLRRPEELRELGMALFLDRPFGDGGPLLASEAYSRSIAEQRLRDFAREPGLLADQEREACQTRLTQGGETRGLSLDAVGGAARPGSVSLTDARRSAPDFVLLRTAPGSVRALRDLDGLPKGNLLLARDAAGKTLVVYDEQLQPLLKLPLPLQKDNRPGLVT